MLVNEFARAAGVEPHVVRYYTRIGLLHPGRNPANNYQLFEDADLERLERIQTLHDLGFALSEIGRFLDQDPADSAVHRAQMIEGLRRNAARNRRRIAELSARQQRIEAALAEWVGSETKTLPPGGPQPGATRGEAEPGMPDRLDLCATHRS